MAPYLKRGDTIALVGCSNGLPIAKGEQLETLAQLLMQEFGLTVLQQPSCLVDADTHETLPATQRAAQLMACYHDERVRCIFDVSGGDLANQVLPLLDYDSIKRYPKPFVGWSDVTTVLNALYCRADAIGFVYQIRHLFGTDATNQKQYVQSVFFEGQRCDIPERPVPDAPAVGGNLRCLLKLAGTPYWPDMQGKVLLLEGLSGNWERVLSYLEQLTQLNVWQQVAGVALGRFSELAESHQTERLYHWLQHIINNEAIVVSVTDALGHQDTAKPFQIG